MAQSNINVAATISKASGPISVIRDGKTLTLNLGDSVFATDTIKTGKESVELSFIDGASSVLSPETTMTVQEFSVNLDSPSFVLSLATGAMRTISGEVVEQNPDAFKIVTPKATVGIRGTTVNSQVRTDGSEVHAVESLSQGHNVTVVAADGTLITITATNQGALIGASSDGAATPYNFTPAEMQELVRSIVSGLNLLEVENSEVEGANDEDDESNSDPDNNNNDEEIEEESDISVELDQSLIDALTDESLSSLITNLEELGIDVTGLGQDLTVDHGLDANNNDNNGIGAASASDGGSGATYEDNLLVVNAANNGHFYADAGVTSGTAVNHRVIIDGDVTGIDNFIFSADVDSFDGTDGDLVAGSDAMIANNMEIGRLVGDANTITNGNFTAGSDTLTVSSKTGGNSIYGDVAEVTGGTISFGNDSIEVSGKFETSSIAGDAFTVSGATITNWGADYISIGGDMTDATIYGDSSSDTANGANDTINIVGSLSGSSSFIRGGGGKDDISVNTMNEGSLYGDEGGDSITVITMKAGSIHADDTYIGNDTIKITNMTGGLVEGDGGNDSIIISGELSKGNINGNSGLDYINVGTLSQTSEGWGLVYGGEDNDTIEITTINGGSTSGDWGDDTITITNMSGGEVDGDAASADPGGKDSITVTGNMTAGTIDAGNGVDTIKIGAMTAGNISAGGGNDEITITTYNGGSIDGGDGTDTIKLTNVSGDLNIADTSKFSNIENFSFKNLSGGHVQGVETGKVVSFENATSGQISISAGNIRAYIEVTNHVDNLTLNTSGGTAGLVFGSGAVDANTKITLTGDRSIDVKASVTGGEAGNDATISSGTFDNKIVYTSGATDTGFGAANVIGNTVFETSASHGVHFWATTFGGDAKVTGGRGNDFIQALDSLTGNAILSGGDGNDSITINKMSGGIVKGGMGNDVINITGFNKGSIDAGVGVNDITVTLANTEENTANTPKIDAGAGNNNIIITAGEDTVGTANMQSIVLKDFTLKQDTLKFANSPVFDETTAVFKSFDGTSGSDSVAFSDALAGAHGDVFYYTFGDKTLQIILEGGGVAGTTIFEITSGTDSFFAGDGSQHITLKSNILSTGDNVYGDQVSINNGTNNYTAGSDTIIASALAVTSNDGNIFGDVGFVESGVTGFTAGADSINVSWIDGGAIYGDLQTTNGASITYGSDTISVAQISSTAKIYGDSESSSEGVADQITVNGAMSGVDAHIYGGGGNDTIEIVGVMSGGSISGQDGNDKIILNTLSGTATVNGDAGDDEITISTLTAGTINLGAGENVLRIGSDAGGSMTDGTITGGAEKDEIFITNMAKGIINLGAGENVVELSGITSSVANDIQIHTGSEKDTIKIEGDSGTKVTLYGFDFTDEDNLSINGDSKDSEEIVNLDGGGSSTLGAAVTSGATVIFDGILVTFSS